MLLAASLAILGLAFALPQLLRLGQRAVRFEREASHAEHITKRLPYPSRAPDRLHRSCRMPSPDYRTGSTGSTPRDDLNCGPPLSGALSLFPSHHVRYQNASRAKGAEKLEFPPTSGLAREWR
jgi:hypothetical protein